MTWTSLREAHRQLVAFRTRAMAGLEGEARRAAAERLCVLRGYAARGVGEVNDAGEDPLVRAAADGAVGAAGVALLLAAGAKTGGEALVAAAKHGQREAVAGLIGSGVAVDSRGKEVMPRESRWRVDSGLLSILEALYKGILPLCHLKFRHGILEVRQ